MPTRLRELHAHIPSHGRELSMLNLSACGSAAEAVDRLAVEASRMSAAREPGWLLATGLRPEAWPDPRWPTMGELDRACPDRPAMVSGFDHHSCVVNRPAFEACGFTDSSADPEGGVIERAGGRPTGVLLESAFNKARAAAPEPTREQWKSIVARGLEDLAGHGFVEVHDLLSPPWLGGVLACLADEGKLAARVWLYPPAERIAHEAELARAYTRPGVRLAGGKLFADGTLNSRTAWVLEPYREPIAGHPQGTPLLSPAQLDHAIDECAGLGLGLAVHAIGDAAVRAVLDAGERSRASAPRVAGVPWLRVEHCELIDHRDVPRFAELGAVASVQPCHLLYDIEVLTRQLPHRLDRVLPLLDLVRAGCEPGRLLWFGSDTPIVRPHPLDSIIAACARARTHQTPGGSPTAAITPVRP